MDIDRPDRSIHIRYPLIYDGYFIFIRLYVWLPTGVKAGDRKAHPTHIDWMCTMHKPILDKKRWIEWWEKKIRNGWLTNNTDKKEKSSLTWLDAAIHVNEGPGDSYSHGIFDSYFRLYNAKCWNGDDQKSPL